MTGTSLRAAAVLYADRIAGRAINACGHGIAVCEYVVVEVVITRPRVGASGLAAVILLGQSVGVGASDGDVDAALVLALISGLGRRIRNLEEVSQLTAAHI